MRMMTLSLWLLAALIGGSLGWISAPTTEASPFEYYVWVHPGGTTSGSSDDLNCGYHQVCLGTPNWGTALDWSNSHGQNVYYRSNSSNSAGYSVSGTGLITETSQMVTGGTCYQTYVWQYRRSGSNDSAVKYTHTATNYEWTQFNIAGGLYPAWTSRVAGQTISEPAGCQTTGPHLHQMTHVGGNHWVNNFYDTMAECDAACGSQNVIAHYQLGYYWTE